MSKISKSIVISEFLWLLFFAVVFLKFDYTRTTLAVVNAIVWLCIVLVFSIIILQFLTRQAFTKVRGILLVLIFLIIDQVIKALLFAFLGAGCILSIISTNEKNMQKKTTNMEAK